MQLIAARNQELPGSDVPGLLPTFRSACRFSSVRRHTRYGTCVAKMSPMTQSGYGVDGRGEKEIRHGSSPECLLLVVWG